jgi:hypothetical protein
MFHDQEKRWTLSTKSTCFWEKNVWFLTGDFEYEDGHLKQLSESKSMISNFFQHSDLEKSGIWMPILRCWPILWDIHSAFAIDTYLHRSPCFWILNNDMRSLRLLTEKEFD